MRKKLLGIILIICLLLCNGYTTYAAVLQPATETLASKQQPSVVGEFYDVLHGLEYEQGAAAFPLVYLDVLRQFVDLTDDMIQEVVQLGGTRGTTWRVKMMDGKEYVIKKEPQEKTAITHMIRISNFYRNKGLPYPHFLPTKTGEEFLAKDGFFFTEQTGFKGKGIGWGAASNKLLVQVAELLAQIHHYGKEYKEQDDERSFQINADASFRQIDAFDTIADEIPHLFEELKDELEKNQAWLATSEKMKLAQSFMEEKDFIMQMVHYSQNTLDANTFAAFPHEYRVHGDFVNANILIDDTENVTGVIDLERTRAQATRWEDILVPLFHLPRLSDCKTFNFDRFALWLTAYNQALLSCGERLSADECNASFLRALLVRMYLKGVHMYLKNRKGFSDYAGMKEQCVNLKNIRSLSDRDFDLLSQRLRNGERWSKDVPEPKITKLKASFKEGIAAYGSRKAYGEYLGTHAVLNDEGFMRVMEYARSYNEPQTLQIYFQRIIEQVLSSVDENVNDYEVDQKALKNKCDGYVTFAELPYSLGEMKEDVVEALLMQGWVRRKDGTVSKAIIREFEKRKAYGTTAPLTQRGLKLVNAYAVVLGRPEAGEQFIARIAAKQGIAIADPSHRGYKALLKKYSKSVSGVSKPSIAALKGELFLCAYYDASWLRFETKKDKRVRMSRWRFDKQGEEYREIFDQYLANQDTTPLIKYALAYLHAIGREARGIDSLLALFADREQVLSLNLFSNFKKALNTVSVLQIDQEKQALLAA